MGTDGAESSAISTTFGIFFGTCPQGYPNSHPVFFGNLSGTSPGVNPYLHQGAPNQSRLPVPVRPESVQARAPF